MTDDAIRLDKWLWFARFFKTRSLATKFCAQARIRVNKRVVSKSATALRVGDVLTFAQAARVRVVKVLALGARRGPAGEALTLYQDLIEAATGPVEAELPRPTRIRGSGRPTKVDRRAFERLRGH